MNLSNNKRVLVVFSPKKAKINIFDFLKKISFFVVLILSNTAIKSRTFFT